MGGMGREGFLRQSDEEIAAAVRAELNSILGVPIRPMFTKIHRWILANPQYTVGHESRLERIQQQLTLRPGLFLAGAAFRGIGIPDCIRQGKEAAQKALNYLAHKN
jgi:oxygen-dependent protoporphyrinogen oxidase